MRKARTRAEFLREMEKQAIRCGGRTPEYITYTSPQGEEVPGRPAARQAIPKGDDRT